MSDEDIRKVEEEYRQLVARMRESWNSKLIETIAAVDKVTRHEFDKLLSPLGEALDEYSRAIKALYDMVIILHKRVRELEAKCGV